MTMRFSMSAVILLGLGFLTGCGGGGEDYKYKDETETPESAYANDVYSQLQEMKRANQDEGPQAVDIVSYLEGMEGYGDDAPVGDHAAAYEEIHAGVKELKQTIDSGGSRSAVGNKIDELLAKAKTLPHTSEEDAAK